jgi:hypothetical protein
MRVCFSRDFSIAQLIFDSIIYYDLILIVSPKRCGVGRPRNLGAMMETEEQLAVLSRTEPFAH